MISNAAASAGIGAAWPWLSLLTQVLILLIGIQFHRLRDRDAFAGDARDVLTPTLARLYLIGAVLLWVVSVGGLALLALSGRASYRTDNLWVVVPVAVVMMTYVGTVQVLTRRAGKVSGRPRGPISELGRFLRIAYGVAVPAAWRRLRSED